MLSSEGQLLHVALAWLMGVTTPPVVKYTNRTKKLTVGGRYIQCIGTTLLSANLQYVVLLLLLVDFL